MHRFDHILPWIQLDTILFELGIQNSQSTLYLPWFGQNTTLFFPRTFANRGGGGGGGMKTHSSVYWFVCPSLCLSQKL